MKKTKLSISTNTLVKVLLILSASLFLISVLFFLIDLIFLSILLLISGLLTRNLKELYYDDEKLYVNQRDNSSQIDFTKIRVIKNTMSNIGGMSVWKIKYLDNDKTKSLRFIPIGIVKNKVFVFADTVKSKNKSIIFQAWSSSFDFDQ